MKDLLYTVRFLALCMVPITPLAFAAWLIYHGSPGWPWFLLVCWFVLNAWRDLEDML